MKGKFSNSTFALVYLGKGERSLGILLKSLGIAIHIPNPLELFFFLWILYKQKVFMDIYPLYQIC
jgi:hypothetical protein